MSQKTLDNFCVANFRLHLHIYTYTYMKIVFSKLPMQFAVYE